MSSPRGYVALALLAVSVALIGCGDAPKHHDVDIRGFVFAPARADASAGDTVVWTNYDLVPHTVTDVDEAWDSGPIAPGAACSLVLGAERDTVAYTCIYHPTMTGSLVLK
jgi:plastocyanin